MPFDFEFQKFREPGLYLLFEDGCVLTLTRDHIERMKKRYLNDPGLLPPSVRQAPRFAPCTICPERDTALICHAIPTVFPFIEEMDRFLSFQKVLAIFRGEPKENACEEILLAAQTTVQRALQYVSILSLLYYCEVGRAYFKYFAGITPFTDPESALERIYLNIHWDLGGNQTAIKALIAKMRRELDITLACQVERLRLFCRSDAFISAFMLTHIITQFLDQDMEAFVRERFDSRSAPLVEPDSVCIEGRKRNKGE